MPGKLKFDEILDDLLSLPRSMLKCLKYYLGDEGSQKMAKVFLHLQSKGIRRVIFVGHSYNYFASIVPFYFFNSCFQYKDNNICSTSALYCSIFEADEFSYFKLCPNADQTMFILISESGNSFQIKNAVDFLIREGITSDNIWGVGNHEDSYLGEKCGLFFPITSGTEEVIGTKSYVNTIITLYLLARAMVGEEALTSDLEQEIRQLIFEVKFYGNDWRYHIKSISDFMGTDYEHLYFISKGTSLSTAQQAALNTKAFTRRFAEGLNIGLFLHGPFQIIQSNPESYRFVVVISDDRNFEDTIKLIDIVSQKMGKGKVVLINNSRELSSLGRGNSNAWVFEHTIKNSYLAPIFEIVVLQFLLMDQALHRGVIEK